jgi:hypothetical protein
MFGDYPSIRFGAEQPLTQNTQEHAASGHQDSTKSAETVTEHKTFLAASMPHALLGTGKPPAGCIPDHTLDWDTWHETF